MLGHSTLPAVSRAGDNHAVTDQMTQTGDDYAESPEVGGIWSRWRAGDLTHRRRRRAHYRTLDVIELSLPLTAIITRELSHHVLDAPLILLRLANHCRFPFFHEVNPQGRVVGRRLELAVTGNRHHSSDPPSAIIHYSPLAMSLGWLRRDCGLILNPFEKN